MSPPPSASVSAHSTSSSQTQDRPTSAHPTSSPIPIPTPTPTCSLLEPIPGQVGAHVNKQVMTTLLTGVEFSTVKRAVKAMETVEGAIRGSCKGFVRLLVRVPVRAQVGCSCNPTPTPSVRKIPIHRTHRVVEDVSGLYLWVGGDAERGCTCARRQGSFSKAGCGFGWCEAGEGRR